VSAPAARGKRLDWRDLPDDVRADITALLGAAVVTAETQAHGFSPGAAARLRRCSRRWPRMFTHRAMQPPPPGLPTLRAFPDTQGRAAREMLAKRLGNR
jgi:hypothetical protein